MPSVVPRIVCLCLSWVDPAPSPEAFTARYRDAVNELSTRYSNIRGEGLFSETVRLDDRSEALRDRSQRIRFAASTKRLWFSVADVPPRRLPADESGEQLFLVDPPHLYTLTRRNEEAQYSIRNVGRVHEGSFGDYVESIHMRQIRCYASMAGIPTSEMIASPGFRVLGIKRLEDPTLLKVDFSYQPGPPPVRLIGHWVLDTEQKWIMREYEYTRADRPAAETFVARGSTRYDVSGDFPLPIETEFHRRFAHHSEAQHFRFDKYELDAGPAALFTLAGYGLGDLAEAPSSGSNGMTFVLIGLAAVVGGLAILLRIVSARFVGRPRNVSS